MKVEWRDKHIELIYFLISYVFNFPVYEIYIHIKVYIMSVHILSNNNNNHPCTYHQLKKWNFAYLFSKLIQNHDFKYLLYANAPKFKYTVWISLLNSRFMCPAAYLVSSSTCMSNRHLRLDICRTELISTPTHLFHCCVLYFD